MYARRVAHTPSQVDRSDFNDRNDLIIDEPVFPIPTVYQPALNAATDEYLRKISERRHVLNENKESDVRHPTVERLHDRVAENNARDVRVARRNAVSQLSSSSTTSSTSNSISPSPAIPQSLQNQYQPRHVDKASSSSLIDSFPSLPSFSLIRKDKNRSISVSPPFSSSSMSSSRLPSSSFSRPLSFDSGDSSDFQSNLSSSHFLRSSSSSSSFSSSSSSFPHRATRSRADSLFQLGENDVVGNPALRKLL
jgi:hypothetical protein